MLMSATGSPASAVGDSFVVHMDRDSLRDFPIDLYDVDGTFVAYEPDREIAWTIASSGKGVGHVYGYRLEAIDEGTIVTQYYDWSAIPEEGKARGIFPVVPESALRATLGISRPHRRARRAPPRRRHHLEALPDRPERAADLARRGGARYPRQLERSHSPADIGHIGIARVRLRTRGRIFAGGLQSALAKRHGPP